MNEDAAHAQRDECAEVVEMCVPVVVCNGKRPLARHGLSGIFKFTISEFGENKDSLKLTVGASYFERRKRFPALRSF